MFEGNWDELDAAATLDAAVEFDEEENRAALGKLEAALHFADLHSDLPIRSQLAPTLPGGERLRVYGGDGCPAVAEFAPAEFGALLKMPSRTAAAYIGEALALRHRFPKILAKARNGQAIVWRARSVARACLNLSKEAAALVDERVVPVIDTLSAYGLQKIIDAVIKEVDPEAAREAAEARARDRGVWVDPSDDHGTKTIFVKAAAGAVIRFDATITDLARALAALGDTDSLAARRAKAIGWIADPAAAYELLAAARYLATNPSDTTAAHTVNGQRTGDSDTGAREGEPPEAHDADDPESDLPGTRQACDGELPEAHHTGANANANEDNLPKPYRAEDPESDLPGTHHACDGDAPEAHGAGKREENAFDTDETGDREDSVPTRHESGDCEDDLRETHGISTCEDDIPEAHDTCASDSGDASDAGGVSEERFRIDEPGIDDEADRDAPHPSQSDHLDYLDNLSTAELQDRMVRLAWRHGHLSDDFSDPTCAPADNGVDPFSRQGLAQRLAEIKQAAYASGLGQGSGRGRARVVLYVHLTDQTLRTGQGVARLEGHGPLIADQVRELLGHDQVTVKPVIDLNERVSVNAYEIPARIRERVKLIHPTEPFPYGTAETTVHTDLDHIQPYRPNGPPGQTSTTTLAPATRFHHRAKTHGGWQVQRLDDGGMEWTTPNGYKFRVDHTGTRRITD